MDDITALLKRRNKELVEMAEKVLKKSKKEVEEKGLMPSITEEGKAGKSNSITSCKYLEERFQQCSKREGVVLAGVWKRWEWTRERGSNFWVQRRRREEISAM